MINSQERIGVVILATAAVVNDKLLNVNLLQWTTKK